MKLTGYAGKATVARVRHAPTTTPGWVNARGQEVVAPTGARSTTREGQTIYRMKCRHCGQMYGANGIDLKARRCPHCQQGAKGEPLTERPAGLFG